MWFTKEYDGCIFLDKRKKQKIQYSTLHEGQGRNRQVNPSLIADNSKIPLQDRSIRLIVFDPPHMIGTSGGIFADVYTMLHPLNWQKYLFEAFKEFKRVLEDEGHLILKWNENSRRVGRVLSIAKAAGFIPLFGSKRGMSLKLTWWVTLAKKT